jgi:hypothetical protein
MTNAQARLIASAIFVLAGGVVAGAPGVNVNLGLAIILVGSAAFIAEYLRSQRS